MSGGRRKVCFGSYFSVVYFGHIWREFVLVPIFLATTSLHLAGSLFWFLFSSLYVAASGGKFVLVSIFPAFSVVLSGGNFVFGSYVSSTNVICFSIHLF